MAASATNPNPLPEFSSDYLWGAWSEVASGSKADMVELCRRRHIPQKMISKAEGRFGRVYVILVGYDRLLSTVTLLGEDGGPVTLMLGPANEAYCPRTPLYDVSIVLERIAEDYPDGTPTAAIAAALGDILEMWTRARHAGVLFNGRTLDQLIAARLAPHIASWLPTEGDTDG